MDFLDFLFPKKCLGCGRTGGYFCPGCLNFIATDPNRICPVCTRASKGGKTHKNCQTRVSLDGLTSIFPHKGLIKKAIERLNSRFLTNLSDDLVEAFLSLCGEDPVFRSYCRLKGVILVPVPTSPKRRKKRGFDQAELLGEKIAENLGIDFEPNFLKRVKNTSSQMGIKKEKREKNVKGAFILTQSLPSSFFSPVILFDDVLGTGATLREAGKVLKKAGVRKVWGLTISRWEN